MEMEIQVFDQEEPFDIPEFEPDPEFDIQMASHLAKYGINDAEDQMILYAKNRKEKSTKVSLKNFIKNLSKKTAKKQG